jgi:mRNA-degrading endonuclease RelE of RelBE toxin-antitoxin system
LIIERLNKKIQKLREDPRVGKPLRKPLAGIWEVYFEHRFRLLYEIDEANKRVIIKGLRHKDEMENLSSV